jgi:V8-like Glu-specific endopeptidase
MKKIYALAIAAMSISSAYAEVKVVYGQDNREDVYSSKNKAAHVLLAKSTAAMVDKRMFVKGAAADTYDINPRYVQSMEELENVCPTERFSQQPLLATCSGFLVSPDTLVTAGHCYAMEGTPEANCKANAWVFDLEMKSADADPTKGISLSNVYLCKSVAAVQLNNFSDYAVIKLDRPVVGRAPLKFRTSGKVADKTNLLVIGHPSGLPLKLADGGKVLSNTDANKYVTSLDTFHGNSGSAVFDSNTGLVEGILIQGKTDYVPSIRSNPKSCLIVNKCDDQGNSCSLKPTAANPETPGEVVMRIEKVAPFITKALATK